MSTFSHTVYINSMKQKGLPLVSNKAAPCTVLSHSLVDSAPHVHQTHRYIHTHRQRHLIRHSLSHMAQVKSCYRVTFPFLHPVVSLDLDEPTSKFIHLSKGSGLLLIHKMTLVWRLFFSVQRSQHPHTIARNAFRFVVLFSSVNPLPALGSPTVASDLVLTLHSVKLVVETQLLSFVNSANAADDDFVTPFECDHLSNAVRSTRVVDISC